ncbi:redox-sensing transcriptional repressor [Brevinema andersonii]|uniref:Redox-sensing transcriptional repressor Rex n=1 Tax=Brevinema andersonii TaxID=34097 RepID=A0A1I1DSD8_BREAD|nr:redox-sensing transcriptional repressor Rex [Brevinema andersonii]SFB77312.1 redox-sensing transcriptional repressor [Brevinema andersonii]
MKKKSKISELVLERLALYHRLLTKMHFKNGDIIDSETFAQYLSLDASLIRRDLSILGSIGRRGKGYETTRLIECIQDFLGKDIRKNVAVIGLGNIGKAIVRFLCSEDAPYSVNYIFDVNPELVGNSFKGIKIYHINEFTPLTSTDTIDFVILTLPVYAIQNVNNIIINSNIKGILNFAPIHLNLPQNIAYREIDVIKELDTLSGLIKHNNSK